MTFDDARKERLFNDIFDVVQYGVRLYQDLFDVTGLADQVFREASTVRVAKMQFAKSQPWRSLSALIDYAVDGIGGLEPYEILCNGAQLLKWISCDACMPSQEWHDLAAKASVRFEFDCGAHISIEHLALLSNVDIREIRLALRGGDLVTCIGTYNPPVRHESAMPWLAAQPSYTPTSYDERSRLNIDRVNTPTEFGHFLILQRQFLGVEFDPAMSTLHSPATPDTIDLLEQGIFTVPLGQVYAIADFYQLSRFTFLACVMRVFFPEQLQMLTRHAQRDRRFQGSHIPDAT